MRDVSSLVERPEQDALLARWEGRSPGGGVFATRRGGTDGREEGRERFGEEERGRRTLGAEPGIGGGGTMRRGGTTVWLGGGGRGERACGGAGGASGGVGGASVAGVRQIDADRIAIFGWSWPDERGGKLCAPFPSLVRLVQPWDGSGRIRAAILTETGAFVTSQVKAKNSGLQAPNSTDASDFSRAMVAS